LSAKQQEIKEDIHITITWNVLTKGLYKSIKIKNLTVQPEAWGGVIGMMWMIAYWATLIPSWIYLIVLTV
jgi:hypothetical protein